MTRPAHDHQVTLPFVTGDGWLRTAVVLGLLVVVAAALARPFVPVGRRARVSVTVVAGAVVLPLLTLTARWDVPQQAVVALLAALVVPIAAARTVRLGRWVAPWAVLAAAAAVAVELLRAGAVDDPRAALATATAVGVAGLSWLMLCRPRTRRVALAVHTLGWLLANGVLAGTTGVAVAGLPA